MHSRIYYTIHLLHTNALKHKWLHLVFQVNSNITEWPEYEKYIEGCHQ